MRIAYAYPATYFDNPKLAAGGSAHIKQFIINAVALRHEVWIWPGMQHPGTYLLPTNRLKRLMALRRMDVIYSRVELDAPAKRWIVPPFRQLLNSPLVVWEFNGVPEFGRMIGQSEADIQSTIDRFRYYGQYCDLAICVTCKLAQYVREKYGIKHILTVPNGSDPDMFQPDIQSVQRIQRKANQLNVVWVGSLDLLWNNFDYLRKAAQLLMDRDESSQIAFHLLGQSSKGFMRDMPPNVHYHGLEDYEMLPRWLAAMDVGLCLYHPGPANYGSPLKLFDYLASGLLVVSTPHPQIEKVFGELGQSDLIVPPDDPEALADLLINLAQHRDRVQNQGKSGRQLVINFYNWRRAVQDTLDEIELMLQERR